MKTMLTFLALVSCVQAHAYNLPSHPIKSYDCKTCDTLSHEKLHDRWTTSQTSLNHPKRNIQKSYSYIKRVTAAQLEQGTHLSINSPGAVISITPIEDKSIPAIQLKGPSSSFIELKDASVLYSQDEAIVSSLRLRSHQAMLEVKPELGSGDFIIKSKKPNTIKNSKGYLIHVFEKNSLIYLEIDPGALHYQYGDQFNAILTLKDGEILYPITEINATLIGPNDQIIPLQVKEINTNQYQASSLLSSEINTQGENWYIEVDATTEIEENNPTQRIGHAAFSYSIPSASLVSIQKISTNPLIFALTAEVATASRYALQSILYTQNAKGKHVPIETAQSAQWLEPGKHTLEIRFDNPAHFSEDTLFVGNLHLIDYGQFKPVYQYDEPIKLSSLLD